MGTAKEIIYLVDDDERIRESLTELLTTFGYEVLSFDSAASFLDCIRGDEISCMILDLQLPDVSGLDLQQQLKSEAFMPIVFITGHGDVPSSVRAMKAGAIEFLMKPVDEADLIAAVKAALAKDRKIKAKMTERARVLALYDTLTPREREVLQLVVSGLLNKQAASTLGISIVTLQAHRGQVMRKMGADSFADLVRMAGSLGFHAATTATKTFSADRIQETADDRSNRR